MSFAESLPVPVVLTRKNCWDPKNRFETVAIDRFFDLILISNRHAKSLFLSGNQILALKISGQFIEKYHTNKSQNKVGLGMNIVKIVFI